jgi:hypothetical protein
MPYPTFVAGDRVTAAQLNAGKVEFVTNAAGAQTNATTTFANATDLSFAVEANARYLIHVLIGYDAPTATDIKFDWSMPSGAATGRNCEYLAAGTTTNIDSNMAKIRRAGGTAVVAGGPNAVANAFSVYEEVTDLITVNAGTAQFRFAANAAGTATLQGDSIIYYQRIE